MHIYVDESGIFANPDNKDIAVSCVAALIIPEPFQKYIFKRFKHLKSSWGIGSGEPKGSSLDEKQVAWVVSVLIDYDIIVKACVIDLGLHADTHILKHKQEQAAAITKNVTPEFHSDLVRELEKLKERLLRLSDQLYVQSVVLMGLVEEVVRVSTLYYCQRIPTTLSSFNWVIDAKGHKLTDYEDLWTTIVSLILQSRSLTYPLDVLEPGVYSWFDRKFDMTMSEPPDHLKLHTPPQDPDKPFLCFDIKKILREHLSFESSENNMGLQLADIVANAIRRACHGNLQPDGWGDLGKLMVSAGKGKNSLKMLALHHDPFPKGRSYGAIFQHFDKQAKPMLSSKFFKEHDKVKSKP